MKKASRETFFLVDYKGKFTIIVDEPDGLDIVTAEINRENAIAQAKWRKEAAQYFGVPAYTGNDPDLLKAYK